MVAFIGVVCFFCSAISVFAGKITVHNDTKEEVYLDYTALRHEPLSFFLYEAGIREEFILSPGEAWSVQYITPHYDKYLNFIGYKKLKAQSGDNYQVSRITKNKSIPDDDDIPFKYCVVYNDTSDTVTYVYWNYKNKEEKFILKEGERKVFKTGFGYNVKIDDEAYLPHYVYGPFKGKKIWSTSDLQCVPPTHIKVVNDLDEKKTLQYYQIREEGGITRSVKLNSREFIYLPYEKTLKIQVDGNLFHSVKPGDTKSIGVLLKNVLR